LASKAMSRSHRYNFQDIGQKGRFGSSMALGRTHRAE